MLVPIIKYQIGKVLEIILLFMMAKAILIFDVSILLRRSVFFMVASNV